MQALDRFLKPRINALGEWCAQSMDPAALVRFALADFARSPALQKCSPESIYLSLIGCAQLGLEPGGVMQHCAIVPFKGTATLQLMYLGAQELALRSERVVVIGSGVLYEGDQYDYDQGSAAFIKHKKTLRDPGPIAGAYAFAELANGRIKVEPMSLPELTAIEKHALKTGTSPAWRDWKDQMYRKSAIKRLCKLLPKTKQAALGFRLDDLALGGQTGDMAETLGVDLETDDRNAPKSATARLKDKLR